MVATTLVLTVHPSVPAQTVSDLVALIKAIPGDTATPRPVPERRVISWASSSASRSASTSCMCRSIARGSQSAFGRRHTPICFASPSPAAQQVVEGRLRGLAVTSKSRSQALPDVPTMAEAGYPHIAGDNWQVSSSRPERLPNRDLPASRDRPDHRAHRGQGATGGARLRAGREHAGGIRQAGPSRVRTWAKVIRASNIKAQ